MSRLFVQCMNSNRKYRKCGYSVSGIFRFNGLAGINLLQNQFTGESLCWDLDVKKKRQKKSSLK